MRTCRCVPLQIGALRVLIGTGRTQAVAAGLIEAGIYPWIYQTVTRDPRRLLDLCNQAGLSVRYVPRAGFGPGRP